MPYWNALQVEVAAHLAWQAATLGKLGNEPTSGVPLRQALMPQMMPCVVVSTAATVMVLVAVWTTVSVGVGA